MKSTKKTVKGEYWFEIHFQTMFSNYNFKTKIYTNLITSNGIKFFLNRLFDGNYNFYSISFGTGNTEPSKTDIELENKIFDIINLNYEVKENVLTLTGETQGNNINGSSEIGIYYINGEEIKLVSRNVHDTLIVPDNSFIVINYYYTITTAEYITSWELVSDTNYTYVTNLNYIPYSVVETDNLTGYHLVESITDVESSDGSYFYDVEEELLYIHCSDGGSPTTHKILVNY